MLKSKLSMAALMAVALADLSAVGVIPSAMARRASAPGIPRRKSRVQDAQALQAAEAKRARRAARNLRNAARR